MLALVGTTAALGTPGAAKALQFALVTHVCNAARI